MLEFTGWLDVELDNSLVFAPSYFYCGSNGFAALDVGGFVVLDGQNDNEARFMFEWKVPLLVLFLGVFSAVSNGLSVCAL